MTDTPPLPEPFASAPHTFEPGALGLSYCDPLDVNPGTKVVRFHCRRTDCKTCDRGTIDYAIDAARLPAELPTYCQATGPVDPLYRTHRSCEPQCPTCYLGHRARLLVVANGAAQDINYDHVPDESATVRRGSLQWPPTPSFGDLLRPDGS